MRPKEEVVRGFILPKRGPSYSRVIEKQERHDFHKIFKKIIENFINEWLKREGKKTIDDPRDLNRMLNELVFYLKGSLLLDPIPGILPSATYGISLHYFLKTEERIDEWYEEWYLSLDGMRKYYALLGRINMEEISGGIFKKYIGEKLRELMDFPADTRPGANTSSLIVHLLTVSALASSIYLSKREKDEKELAILRILSLFHDIGKFIDIAKHESISIDDIKEIFSERTSGEAKKIIEAAIELLSGKKDSEYKELESIFRKADVLASALDRLSNLLPEIIEEELRKELLEKAIEYYQEKYGEKIDEGKEAYRKILVKGDWKFWKELGIETVRKLTESFCRRVTTKEILKKQKVFESEEKISHEEVDVYLVRLDLRGIQKYIRSNEIRIMKAGSRVIDALIYTSIPLYVAERIGLPAESILYSGGGNLTLIVPGKYLSELKNMRKEFYDSFKIEIVYGKSRIGKDFFSMNREIEDELRKEKTRLIPRRERGEVPVKSNAFKSCDSCGTGVAVRKRDGKHLCELCDKKYEIGTDIHFRPVLRNLLEKEELECNEELILKDVMLFLAGHDPEEIERGIDRYKDISLIRVDGNVMGAFMSSSLSITDSVERSIRIDTALKKSIHETYENLRSIGGLDHIRFYLGIIYAGGDDGAFLLPGKISIPIAVFLANRFYMECGCKVSLSCGISTAKPKHPINLLYEASGYLLDEHAKSDRELAYEETFSEVTSPSSDYRGSISFYSADGGILNEHSLKSAINEIGRFTIMYGTGEGRRTFRIAEVDRSRSILKLFELLNDYGALNESIGLDNLDRVIDASLELAKSENTVLREIRRDLLSIMHSSIMGDQDLRISYLFALRGRERRRYSSIIDNLLEIRGEDFWFNLYDAYILVKMLGGL